MAQVLGVLKSPEETVSAIHSLKAAGLGQVEVYSPVPDPAIEQAIGKPTSGISLATLIGSLTGVSFAYFFQIWCAYDWPLVVGGKPFAAIPAYTIIGFELNILFGAVLTVAALMVFGIWRTRRGHEIYQPGFSGDLFGCIVSCHGDQVGRAQDLLRRAGSTEVRVVEG